MCEELVGDRGTSCDRVGTALQWEGRSVVGTRQWVASQRPRPGFGEPVGETTYDACPSVPASTWGREPRGGSGVGGSQELATMRPLLCAAVTGP